VVFQARDTAPDRLELGLHSTPVPQERRPGVFARLHGVLQLGALAGRQHPICHALPLLDGPGTFEVDSDIEAPAECHQHHVLRVRDAEPEPSPTRIAPERRLAVQSFLEWNTGRCHAERAADDLAQRRSPNGEATRDHRVRVRIESRPLVARKQR